MILTYEQMFNRLAEKSIDNTKQLRRAVAQRRNGMEDLYGVEFNHNGDANSPATFYVSVSPDLVYYERFAFKFIIEPFASSVAGVSVSGDDMSIGSTSLSISGGGGGSQVISGTSTLDDASASGSITPNPHTHSVSGGSMSATVNYGINQISTSSANWRVRIAGVDITDYLIEQQDGNWINGQGIYPNNRVEDEEDFYDILDVACMLDAEGKTAERELILATGFKKVEVLSDAPFGLTAFLYLKYSHLNR